MMIVARGHKLFMIEEKDGVITETEMIPFVQVITRDGTPKEIDIQRMSFSVGLPDGSMEKVFDIENVRVESDLPNKVAYLSVESDKKPLQLNAKHIKAGGNVDLGAPIVSDGDMTLVAETLTSSSGRALAEAVGTITANIENISRSNPRSSIEADHEASDTT